MPVGPSVEVLISLVSSSLNFSSAGLIGQTGTKFGDEKRKTESFRIFITLDEALFDPSVASSVKLGVGFTMLGTDSRTQNTAVVMVVQNVLVRTNLTTGRSLKSDGVLLTTSSASRDLIGHLNRLKPHGVVDVICLVSVKNLLIHWSKESLVSNSWFVEVQILEVVSRVGLVKRIITNHKLVA